MNSKKKLILLLQKAHAGELAAYLAYKGHLKSLSYWTGENDREYFRNMINDEWHHICNVDRMLFRLGSKTSQARDSIFIIIGVVVACLCHISTEKMKNRVALWLEDVGVNSYNEMADIAESLGYDDMAEELDNMATVEQDHKTFFENKMAK